MATTNSSYFESYENLDVHQLMLKDVARNEAYRRAIFDNKDAIKDKVVLDVGAGTGILSVFCAQAGAARIYAVEASNTFKIAEEVVKENNFEAVIQVIHSKVEDVVLPEKVDVIVSEWMGFYLLHEGMLDSVLVARDKFLKPDGLMFPESATLYAAPCSMPSMFEFWNDINGVSMQSFAAKLRSEASSKPLTTTVAPEHLLSDPEVVVWLDLREITSKDVEAIEVQHVVMANKTGNFQGICLWFTCTFPSFVTEPVTLSTEPEEPATHWMQTAIVLPVEDHVCEFEPMAYTLRLARALESDRRYNIELTMLDPETVEHPEYCPCHMARCHLVRLLTEKYERESLAAE